MLYRTWMKLLILYLAISIESNCFVYQACFFSVAKKLSATALSQQTPVRPLDSTRSLALAQSASADDVYWAPRSEWNIAPPATYPCALAIVNASMTRLVSGRLEVCQPTTMRVVKSSTTPQVEPPLSGTDVSDIRYQHRRRHRWDEPPVDSIGVLIWVDIDFPTFALRISAVNTYVLHQAPNEIVRGPFTVLVPKYLGDFANPCAITGGDEDVLDQWA